jgi:hypothetical protein
MSRLSDRGSSPPVAARVRGDAIAIAKLTSALARIDPVVLGKSGPAPRRRQEWLAAKASAARGSAGSGEPQGRQVEPYANLVM